MGEKRNNSLEATRTAMCVWRRCPLFVNRPNARMDGARTSCSRRLAEHCLVLRQEHQGAQAVEHILYILGPCRARCTTKKTNSTGAGAMPTLLAHHGTTVQARWIRASSVECNILHTPHRRTVTKSIKSAHWRLSMCIAD